MATHSERLIEFLGRRTAMTMAGLTALGPVMFGLELAFAFLLAQFLSQLGVISPMHGSERLWLSGWRVTALLAAAGVTRVVVTYAQVVIDGSAMERFCHRLRVEMIGRALRTRSLDAGATLTFFHQTVLHASIALHSLQVALTQGVICVGLIGVLFVLNPALTAALLAVTALVWAPLPLLRRRIRYQRARQIATFSRVMDRLANVFRNLPLIRMHHLQALEEQRFEQDLRAYSGDMTAYFRAEAASTAVTPLLIVGGLVGVAIAQQTSLAIAPLVLVPYLVLFIRLAQQTGPLASSCARFVSAAPDLRRAWEWWLPSCERSQHSWEQETARSVDERAGRRGDPPSPLGWRVRGLTFGYTDHPPLFSRVDLVVRPGSFVHIAGASGSGKTTLIALLTGEREPEAGTIDVVDDGSPQPLGFAAATLRSSIGYSAAEPYLFAGSVRENVTYGLDTPPDERLLADAIDCAACEFLLQLPEKLDYQLDERGEGLSAGQRQRISLLRALLRRPRALILDEALSNLDDATEERVLRNLLSRRPRPTILWISHRTPAILRPDQRVDLSPVELPVA